MKRLALFTVAVAAAVQIAAPVAAKPPLNWDGLVQVKAKRLDLVYLQPGADFRGYTKVMLAPTELAFEKPVRCRESRLTRALRTLLRLPDAVPAYRTAIFRQVDKHGAIFHRRAGVSR